MIACLTVVKTLSLPAYLIICKDQCLSLFLSTFALDLDSSKQESQKKSTFLSETATYSLVCELKTAEQVRVCPCLTVQLPSGFWSDTCLNHNTTTC